MSRKGRLSRRYEAGPGHPAGASPSHANPSVAAAEDNPGISLARQPCDGVMRKRGLRNRMVIPHRVTRDNASRTMALLILLAP